QHLFEVVERLAHPHEDHVAGMRAQVAGGDGVLRDDLPRLEVADEAEPSRLAEDASARTADLAGEADGETRRLPDEHGLHHRAVAQADRESDRPVPVDG